MACKLFTIVMALLIVGMPVFAQQAPQTEIQIATKDAKQDAQQNVSMLAWGAYGLGCWIVALPHALIGNPEIPVDRLMGKPPEYVNTYTLVYRQYAKRRRLQAAAIGCGVGTALGYFMQPFILNALDY